MEKKYELGIIEENGVVLIESNGYADGTVSVSKEAFDALLEYAIQTDVAELLTYLKGRVESYNNTIDFSNTEEYNDKKFAYTSAFVKELYVTLLQEGLSTEEIIDALDNLQDYQLFGNTFASYNTEDIEVRVEYIVTLVNLLLNKISYDRAEIDEYNGKLDEVANMNYIEDDNNGYTRSLKDTDNE